MSSSVETELKEIEALLRRNVSEIEDESNILKGVLAAMRENGVSFEQNLTKTYMQSKTTLGNLTSF